MVEVALPLIARPLFWVVIGADFHVTPIFNSTEMIRNEGGGVDAVDREADHFGMAPTTKSKRAKARKAALKRNEVASNVRLLKLADRHRPPQKWFEQTDCPFKPTKSKPGAEAPVFLQRTNRGFRLRL